MNLAKRSSTGAAAGAGSGGAVGAAGAPGLGDSHATHFMASAGLEIMQTSQTQDPLTLGFMNLANKSSTVGLISAGFSDSFSLLSSTPFFSSVPLLSLFSFFFSVSPVPPKLNPGASESVPFVCGLERKLKASAALVLLVEENPLKLEKIFFF